MNTRKQADFGSTLLKGLAYAALATTVAVFALDTSTSIAQQAASNQAPANPTAGQGRGRGGRGGVPNITPEQTAALTQMNADLAPLTQSLAAARSAVVAASLATPRNAADVQTKVAAVKSAELALANARSAAFAKIQGSPNKFAPDQISALATTGGGAGRGGRGANVNGLVASVAPKGPDINGDQGRAINAMNSGLAPQMQKLQAARSALVGASFAVPQNDADMQAKANDVSTAELALAQARAEGFAKLQASPNKLDAEQTAALVNVGGTIGGFQPPTEMDFDYHKGYISLFDGTSLKGWDGNSKFWRVEDGAIVGESTPTNPSGNTYLVYRGVEAHDFTLKLEIKIVGDGGSGIQYRSKTGLPWTADISPAVTANVGPVNLNWMMTGPQADFWPTNGSDTFSGQFYMENDPMRIMAWRGEVVEGQGPGLRHLMGRIGDHGTLGALVKKNDWNQYTIIARGGTFIHILNGQLMSVMVDDDPKSLSNQSGYFGIEIEATTKVFVRNIWLKKLN